jgi:protein-tyrosine phosphatase
MDTMTGSEGALDRRPIPAATNLRDLGGYRTADGATVKWRRLYRSNELSKLDGDTLAALGIRTVCDFRHDEESALAPTRLPLGTATAIHAVPIKVTGSTGGVLSSGKATAADVRQMLRDVYRIFAIEHAGAYRALFDRLVEPGHYPLVFHCTAGKDRTGVAAALVLSALRVAREAIVEDYLLTNTYWTKPADLLSNLSGEVREAVLDARPDYLQAAFDAIDAAYGSLDVYLAKAMGLTAERRRRLERLLLD